MKLIVTSSEDPASMNIRARLTEAADWSEGGAFSGHPVLKSGGFLMVQVDRIHLEEDHIDGRVASETGERIDATVFASRHSSESRIPTLTVHPVGNYSSADFGGQEGTLCPTAPRLMTGALRQLVARGEGLGFKISFETTHHGPVTDGAAFFIEIGSYDELWRREDAARAVADSILAAEERDAPAVVCVGGGHYAPRFTEMVLSRNVAVGHMAANYALDSLDEGMVRQMARKSDDAGRVYFHRKGMPKPAYRELRERFAACGVEEASSGDFEEL